MQLFLVCIVSLILFPGLLSAQFTISAEIRPRAEYRHGFMALANQNQDAAFFIDQRSRINAGFIAKQTEIYITLQDVRTWGNQPQLVVNNGAATGIHQACRCRSIRRSGSPARQRSCQ